MVKRRIQILKSKHLINTWYCQLVAKRMKPFVQPLPRQIPDSEMKDFCGEHADQLKYGQPVVNNITLKDLALTSLFCMKVIKLKCPLMMIKMGSGLFFCDGILFIV